MKRRRTDGERGRNGARFNPKAIGLHNSLRLAAIFSALFPQCMCLVPSGRESRACAICVVFISCRPLALLLLDRHHSFRASRFRCFWKKKRLELQAEPSRAEPGHGSGKDDRDQLGTSNRLDLKRLWGKENPCWIRSAGLSSSLSSKS